MMSDNIINFPGMCNDPVSAEVQREVDEIFSEIEQKMELLDSYLFDGPSDDPFTRKLQERLYDESEELFESMIQSMEEDEKKRNR